MEGPRPATAGEVEGAAALANRVFRSDVGLGPTMHKEFPRLFDAEHPEQLWVMVDQGRVVSLVGVFGRTLRLPWGCLPTAAIGAVCTDPAYRGQGLAGRILRQLGLHLREQGVELLIISGDRPLYRRLGAVRAGLVRWLTVPARAGEGQNADLVVEEVHPEQEEALVEVLRLYEREPIHFQRDVEDLRGFVAALPYGFDGTRYRRLWLARPGRGRAAIAYLTTDGPAARSTGGPAKRASDRLINSATGPAQAASPVYWQAREWGGDRRVICGLAAELGAEHQIAGISLPIPAYDSAWLSIGAESGVHWDPAPAKSWGGTFVALAPTMLVARLRRPLGDELAGELLAAVTAGRLSPPDLLTVLFGQECSWWAQSQTAASDRSIWVERLLPLLGLRPEDPLGRERVEKLAHVLPLPWVWGNTLNYV